MIEKRPEFYHADGGQREEKREGHAGRAEEDEQEEFVHRKMNAIGYRLHGSTNGQLEVRWARKPLE